jgi:hypothetical protein
MPSYRGRNRTVTLRPEPRISVNKLGEYLIATASVRSFGTKEGRPISSSSVTRMRSRRSSTTWSIAIPTRTSWPAI